MSPSITRALLLTDVVESTKLSEQLGNVAMAQVWAAHDRAARDLLVPHRGREIDKTDGFLLLFETAADAAAYALAYHRALATLDPPLRARAGLHVGDVVLTENLPADVARGAKPLEVDGLAKPTGARIMALATGGQTLLSDAAREALGAAPEGCELRSHGHYMMKGVADPIEIFEFGVAGESPFTPPPDVAKGHRVVLSGDLWRPAREIKHSLPAERDAFVGRREDLNELALRLDAGERLVTVLGMGGTGKTRLVRRYGWTWMGDWPGGVCFCDLSEARSLDGIAVAVAGALDVPLGKDDPVAQLGHAIAGRGRCLVILDNFEQVTEHARATVGHWLERAADAAFVVTSREILSIPGEHVMPLAPLSPDGPGEELFAVRARARKAAFALTASNRPTVREIVRLLDGLPLAIELAAARSAVLSPEQLLVRLKDRFQILVGARDSQARQATLRAAIDWSWTLLSPWEQAVLAQASVFVGGFTLEAAEGVVDLSAWPGAPPTMDIVQALVDKSLFHVGTPGAGQRLDIDEPYFGMYLSIHEYAAEKLRSEGALPDGASGPSAESSAFERHGRFFAAFGTDEAIAALDAPGGVARLQALIAELENLVAACRRAMGRQDAPTAAATFVAAANAIALRGPQLVAVELGQQVLALTGLSSSERARVVLAVAERLAASGRLDEARKFFETALACAREAGDRRVEALAFVSLGIVHHRQGRGDDALRHYQDALAIARELGHRSPEASALYSLAILEGERARKEDAEAHSAEALAIYREVGSRRNEGRVLCSMGIFLCQQGRYDEALRAYDEALAIQREVGNRSVEGIVLGNLGNLYYRQGSTEEALRCFEEALAIQREVGDRVTEGSFLGNLGIVQVTTGRLDDAVRSYEGALAIAREAGNRAGEGQALANLGRLHSRRGRVVEERHAHEAALAIAREIGDRRAEGHYLGDLGNVHAAEGHVEEGRRLLEEALAIHREVGDRRFEGVRLCDLGALLVADGRADEGRRFHEEALAIFRALGARREQEKVLCQLGNLHAREGRMPEARAALEEAEAFLRAAQNRLELAMVLCDRAECERLAGDVVAARRHLAEAEGIARELAAGPGSPLGKEIDEVRAALG